MLYVVPGVVPERPEEAMAQISDFTERSGDVERGRWLDVMRQKCAADRTVRERAISF